MKGCVVLILSDVKAEESQVSVGSHFSSARSPRYLCPPPVCPTRLLDHLIGKDEQARGNREAEGLGRLHVDDQFHFCGLLDR